MVSRWSWIASVCCLVAVFASCDDGGGVSLTVSPAAVTLAPLGSVTFTASVVGTVDRGVAWSATGGEVVPSGLTAAFTAPAASGVVEVTVRSVAHPTAAATAIVIVSDGAGHVAGLAPEEAVLRPGSTQTFVVTGALAGAADLRWSATGGEVVAVADGAVYTAPQELGDYHLTATSVEQPAVTATARIFVRDAEPGVAVDAGFGLEGRVASDFRLGQLRAVGTVPAVDGGFFTVWNVDDESGGFATMAHHIAVSRHGPSGELHQGYGDRGVTVWHVGEALFGGVNDVAPLADGGLLASGRSQSLLSREGWYNSEWTDALVMRFDASGAPVASFGASGTVRIRVAAEAANGVVRAFELDDGGIVLVGGVASDPTSGSYATVIKLLPDGGLDASFGDGGVATFHALSQVVDAALHTDGAVIVTGYEDFQYERAIRVLPDGTLDSAFGESGLLDIGGSGDTNSQPHVVGTQSGAVYVAQGHYAGYADPVNRVVLKRYSENGELDVSFGDAGTIAVSVPTAWSTNTTVMGVTSGASGELIIYGRLVDSLGAFEPQHVFVAVTDPDGRAVDGFGESGLHLGPPGTAWSPFHVRHEPRGGYLVSDGAGVHRLEPTGAVDHTFGVDGLVEPPDAVAPYIGNWWDLSVGGVVRTDRDRLIGVLSADEGCTLLGYATDGTVDRTFGAHGRVHLLSDVATGCTDISVGRDGLVYVSGYRFEREPRSLRALLMRLAPDGALDETFGLGGVREYDWGSDSYFQRVYVDEADRVVLAGRVDGRFAVVRLDAAGDLDGGFGIGGVAYAAGAERGEYDAALELGWFADGGFVARGVSGPGMALAVYRRDGQLDTRFGGTGQLSVFSDALLVDDSDRIVFISRGCYLARMLRGGMLDPQFRSNGERLAGCEGQFNGGVALFQQPNGSILSLVNHRRSGPGEVFGGSLRVYRHDVLGDPDASLGTAGFLDIADTDPRGWYWSWHASAVGDDRIVAVGTWTVDLSGEFVRRHVRHLLLGIVID